MGSKNQEQKNTTSMIDQERQRQAQEHQQFLGYAQPERQAEKGWADTTRGKIMEGYENLYKNATGTTDMFGGNFGGGGGYTPAVYNPQTAKLSGFTGEAAGIARILGQGGEWDPRIRSGYGNFAETGGYSDADVANIRGRAASVTPAFYDAVRNRMSQRMAASGLNAGSVFNAASDRMTRDSAAASAASARDAEISLQDNIRQGKLAGLAGLTGLDTSANQFRGTGMSGLLSAGSEETALNQYNTNILNEASKYNAENANAAAAAGASAANRARDERVREYMMGLSGMEGMYGSSPAELARYDQMLMQGRFGQAGNIGENLSLRMQNNPRQPSTWDRIMQGAGIAGGVAGAWLGA